LSGSGELVRRANASSATMAKRRKMVAAEGGNGLQAAHARPEGERGEVEQRGQGLSAAAWRARIGKGSEDVVPRERRTGQEPSPRGHPTQPVNRLSPSQIARMQARGLWHGPDEDDSQSW
jgi:hypothetical protein